MIVFSPHKHIPSSEIKVSFARSGGAGGQNVNKTSTKAVIRWRIGDSNIINDIEKKRLRIKLANKINSNDEVVVYCEQERSQLQNRILAMQNLQLLVDKALKMSKVRLPTKPSKASKMKRIESKKMHSRLKMERRNLE